MIFLAYFVHIYIRTESCLIEQLVPFNNFLWLVYILNYPVLPSHHDHCIGSQNVFCLFHNDIPHTFSWFCYCVLNSFCSFISPVLFFDIFVLLLWK
jgi:hypothetical protein